MRGFSWKRAIGVSRLKNKIARATGIPTTRSGRARKWGFWPILARASRGSGPAPVDDDDDEEEGPQSGGCGGCLVLLLLLIGGCVFLLKTKSNPLDHPSVTPPRPQSAPARVPFVPVEPIRLEPETMPTPPPWEPQEEPIPEAVSEPVTPVTEHDPQLDRWAASQLNLAKQYLKIKKNKKAIEILDQIIERVPHSPAADEARKERERATPPPSRS